MFSAELDPQRREPLHRLSQILGVEVGVDRCGELWIGVPENLLRLDEPDAIASKINNKLVAYVTVEARLQFRDDRSSAGRRTGQNATSDSSKPRNAPVAI